MIPTTIIIMKTDTAMPILMSLRCLILSRNFYCTSEMLLMKEWCMKCKIYMKTRMLLFKYCLYIMSQFLTFYTHLYYQGFQNYPINFLTKLHGLVIKKSVPLWMMIKYYKILILIVLYLLPKKN